LDAAETSMQRRSPAETPAPPPVKTRMQDLASVLPFASSMDVAARLDL